MPIGQDNRQGLTGNMRAQWTIATNLQRILNTYAVEWGLTVSKVEIRLVTEAAGE